MPRQGDSPAYKERRRRTHQRIDSYGEAAARIRRGPNDRDSPGPSPSKSRPKPRQQDGRSSRDVSSHFDSQPSSTALSSERLAKLNQLNQQMGWDEYDEVHRPPVEDQTHAEFQDDDREWERRERHRQRRHQREAHEDRRRRRRQAELAEAQNNQRYEGPSRPFIPVPTIENQHSRRDVTETQRSRRDVAENRTSRRDITENQRSRRDISERQDSSRDVRKASGQRTERQDVYYSEKERWKEEVHSKHGSQDSSFHEEATRRKRVRRLRCIIIAIAIVIVVIAIAVPVGVTLAKKKGSSSNAANGSSSPNSSQSSQPSSRPTSHPKSNPASDVPAWAKGGYLDPADWYDTTDFNLTFTNATVGGLYIMGLNSSWNDDTRANDNVPPLNEAWDYGTVPYRGVNLGGWLSIEPFITPSLFDNFDSSQGVVDEWTLSKTLGPSKAKSTIEQHYSDWVQESTFAEIQAAGFDHVRIPFSYWAVTVYDGDPYVPMISWRYLLRGIEWARKYGLRINLDLHGAPGSQNGWNHSGRQGLIGWLNGTDGALNGQRTIDIHKQLSTFFTQPRYKNIITMYGLVNEPRMMSIPPQTVENWSKQAITAIRGNGYNGLLIMGDGFLSPESWKGQMQGIENLVLDSHQYVIFNTELLVYSHYNKISFACGGWSQQTRVSMNPATGFGPTMFGEWSQADTDCTQYLNDVGVGSRWEGTLQFADTPGGTSSGSVLKPTCPTHNNPPCSCAKAIADPSTYSAEYKAFLLMFAEAQMSAFELGWGWFYWTWRTESATQWSYKDGLAAGILPPLAYQRDWNCNMSIPEFAAHGLPEYY